jgi:hypothetical protein
LKELTNFDPYLRESFNNWLGVTWDEEAQAFKKNSLLKPIMSFQGAAWCIGLLKTYARRNNIITDLGRDEFRNIVMDHIDAVWLNLGTRDELGIENNGDLIRVCNELEHAASLVLMGAGDGKYNKFLGTTYSHHTTNNEVLQRQNEMVVMNKKSGFLDRFKSMIMGK